MTAIYRYFRSLRMWTRHHRKAHGCSFLPALRWAHWNAMNPVVEGGKRNIKLTVFGRRSRDPSLSKGPNG